MIARCPLTDAVVTLFDELEFTNGSLLSLDGLQNGPTLGSKGTRTTINDSIEVTVFLLMLRLISKICNRSFFSKTTTKRKFR